MPGNNHNPGGIMKATHRFALAVVLVILAAYPVNTCLAFLGRSMGDSSESGGSRFQIQASYNQEGSRFAPISSFSDTLAAWKSNAQAFSAQAPSGSTSQPAIASDFGSLSSRFVYDPTHIISSPRFSDYSIISYNAGIILSSKIMSMPSSQVSLGNTFAIVTMPSGIRQAATFVTALPQTGQANQLVVYNNKVFQWTTAKGGQDCSWQEVKVQGDNGTARTPDYTTMQEVEVTLYGQKITLNLEVVASTTEIEHPRPGQTVFVAAGETYGPRIFQYDAILDGWVKKSLSSPGTQTEAAVSSTTGKGLQKTDGAPAQTATYRNDANTEYVKDGKGNLVQKTYPAGTEFQAGNTVLISIGTITRDSSGNIPVGTEFATKDGRRVVLNADGNYYYKSAGSSKTDSTPSQVKKVVWNSVITTANGTTLYALQENGSGKSSGSSDNRYYADMDGNVYKCNTDGTISRTAANQNPDKGWVTGDKTSTGATIEKAYKLDDDTWYLVTDQGTYTAMPGPDETADERASDRNVYDYCDSLLATKGYTKSVTHEKNGSTVLTYTPSKNTPEGYPTYVVTIDSDNNMTTQNIPDDRGSGSSSVSDGNTGSNGWVSNGNGTYSDGNGHTLTPNADGSYVVTGVSRGGNVIEIGGGQPGSFGNDLLTENITGQSHQTNESGDSGTSGQNTSESAGDSDGWEAGDTLASGQTVESATPNGDGTWSIETVEGNSYSSIDYSPS